MIYFRGGQLDGIKTISPTEEDIYADWDQEQEAYVMTNEDGEVQGLMKAAVGPPTPMPLGPPLKWYKNIKLISNIMMLLAIFVFEVGTLSNTGISTSVMAGAFVLSILAYFMKGP